MAAVPNMNIAGMPG